MSALFPSQRDQAGPMRWVDGRVVAAAMLWPVIGIIGALCLQLAELIGPAGYPPPGLIIGQYVVWATLAMAISMYAAWLRPGRVPAAVLAGGHLVAALICWAVQSVMWMPFTPDDVYIRRDALVLRDLPIRLSIYTAITVISWSTMLLRDLRAASEHQRAALSTLGRSSIDNVSTTARYLAQVIQLIRQDLVRGRELAERSAMAAAALLRNQLKAATEMSWPLRREANLVDDYLGLERVRGRYWRVIFDWSDRAAESKVWPGSVAVEISSFLAAQTGEPGEVTVTIDRNGADLAAVCSTAETARTIVLPAVPDLIDPPAQRLERWTRFIAGRWYAVVFVAVVAFWLLMTSVGLLNTLSMGFALTPASFLWNGIRSALKVAFVLPLIQRIPLPALTLPRVAAVVVLAAVGAEWWYHFARGIFVYGGNDVFAVAAALTLASTSGAFMSVCGLAFTFVMFRVSVAVHRETAAAAFVIRDAHESQRRVLLWQTNPHLLFNALTALVTLIRRDAAAASSYLERLAAFYERVRHIDPVEPARLRSELDLLADYVEIERVRFGGATSLTIVTADDTTDAIVPALLLQPLIENAVKHGSNESSIAISAQRDGAFLRITITNSVRETAFREDTGLGLRIVRERLEHLYGGNAALEIELRDQTFTSRVTLPFAIA